jgi:LPXTG-motif cell wall-anchored protein
MKAKRLLSVLLCAALVLTLLPITVWADSGYCYIDENGDTAFTGSTTVTQISGDTAALTSGWYVVKGTVSRTGTITVSGDVHLILADGASLEVTGDGNNAGVNVSGGDSGAGIGGGYGSTGGVITINDGTVTANGGGDGAGIGGGGIIMDDGGSGGTIIINGGTVRANGSGGAGIGGGGTTTGNGGGGGTIIINGGTVTANTSYGGAGIGGGGVGLDGHGGNGGDITFTGGTVTATSSFGEGIGGGYGIGGSANGGKVTISGGSVNAGIQSTPTNGTANESQNLSLAETAIPGATTGTAVLGLTIEGASYYGTKDLFTDAAGKLYLWLPQGAAVTGARTETTIFTGASGALTADTAAPTVSSVTPSGTNVSTSGNIVVTFSEEMRSGSGAVSLDGGTTTLTGGSWDTDKTVYTVPYSGLDSGTLYTVTISGFQDYSGNEMASDASHSFTTASTDASLSALTLSEGALSPDFASGTDDYTASVGNSVSSVTITPTASHSGATITVNGNSVTSGAASGEIALNVGENTIEIEVTAQDGTTTNTYTVTVTRAQLLYIFRTLTDSATGVTVSGIIREDAVLTVGDMALGTGAACDAIRERMNDDSYITLFDGDISLSQGFTGSLTVTVPVGSGYNGETVTVLHCANGELQTYTATVRDGKATFTVASLSPFAVFADADDALDDIPKTGDNGGFPLWLGLMASGVLLGVLLLLRRRTKRA